MLLSIDSQLVYLSILILPYKPSRAKVCMYVCMYTLTINLPLTQILLTNPTLPLFTNNMKLAGITCFVGNFLPGGTLSRNNSFFQVSKITLLLSLEKSDAPTLLLKFIL